MILSIKFIRPCGTWLGASALLMVLAPWPAQALQTDRSEPIAIESDEAERDDSKGTTTYAGRVVMQQGSMKITADKVVIYSDKDKVTQIVATGKPARYEQQPSAGAAVVVAQANTLEYQLQDESLHLIENAFLEQEGTNLSGNRIDYDVRKSLVKAGGESKTHERVRMIINPKVLNRDDKPAGDKPTP